MKTVEEQIEILEEVKVCVQDAEEEGHHIYLCNVLKEILNCPAVKIGEEIPLFTFENAEKYAVADRDLLFYNGKGGMNCLSPWWRGWDYEHRKMFLDWMIKELKVISLYGPDYL